MLWVFFSLLCLSKALSLQCNWLGYSGLGNKNTTSCSPLFYTSSANVVAKVENIPPPSPVIDIDYSEIYPTFHSIPVPRTILPEGRTSKSYVAAVALTQDTYSRSELIELAKAKASIAAAQGSDMLVFPETFFIGPYTTSCDSNITTCKQWQKDSLDLCSSLSLSYNMWIVCPLFYWEYSEHFEQYQKYNTAFVYNRKGEQVGRYDKMFPVYEPYYGIGNEQLQPSRRGIQVWDTDFGMRMCMVICNDIFFPELMQQCASLGADLLVWPAAWKGGRLLPAYAMVHNMWIVNAPGPYDTKRSWAVDNVGRIIGEEDTTYLDTNLKIVQIETEQVVIHTNFNGRVSEMLSKHSDDVRIQNNDYASEIIILQPARASGYPVRALLRAYNIPTVRELAEWMRKYTNAVRMEGKSIPATNPLYPS